MTTSEPGRNGVAPKMSPLPDPLAAGGGDLPSDLPSVESLARLANDLFGSFSHGGFSPPASPIPSAIQAPQSLPGAAAMGQPGASLPRFAVPADVAPLYDVPQKLASAQQTASKPDASTPPLSSEQSYYFLQSAQHAAGNAHLSNLGGLALGPEITSAAVSASQAFDVHAIRRDFPILQEQVNGRQLIWLDNAATTQKPQAVIDRLSHFYQHENSNIHRAAHELAARSTDAYEKARDTVARFIHASSSREIVFVRGGTEAINLVAQSWGRQNIGAGDEIVITWLEHHANIVPWQQLAAEKGATLRVAPVDDRGQIQLDEFQKLLGSKTRLVAFPQVSNALGTVTPAKEMTAMARRYGARVLIDAAQSVAHSRTDVQDLDCDWLVFSGHKVYGPTGIGVLYGREDLLNATNPWQGGGNMIQNVTFEKTTYQPAPNRFEAGTGNIADAVGLGAALEYINGIGMENIARYEQELLAYATSGLQRIAGLHLIGTAAEKAGVLSFVIDGLQTEEVGKALNEVGIAVRAGHHCAQPILRRFGVESTVRPSFALYNTYSEIDTLVTSLRRIAAAVPRSKR